MSKIKARITSLKNDIGIWGLCNLEFSKWPKWVGDTLWDWACCD